MKTSFILFSFLLFTCLGYSQIEIPRANTGGILKAENKSEKPSSFPILKREESKSESRFLKDKPKAIDFRETRHDMLTASDVIKEKWTKDREAKDEYKVDQYLGDFKTLGKFVELYCRDHEYVDGDKVKIIVNGEVVEASVSLHSGFYPVLVTLREGFNTIEFEALNQGTSGPNTAELRVLDEQGAQMIKKEWNLLTGAKASLIVVKQ